MGEYTRREKRGEERMEIGKGRTVGKGREGKG